MKHEKVKYICYSILGNAICLLIVWFSAQSPIWEEDGNGDAWVKLFAIVGILAVFFGVNWVIDKGTEIETEED